MPIGIQGYGNPYGNYNILQEKQALMAELSGKNGGSRKNIALQEILGKATEDKIEIRRQEQDREKLRELSAQAASDHQGDRRINASAFRAMTAMLFKDQAIDTVTPQNTLSAVYNASAANSEDPWGAKAVSEKILKFAKSLSNGDDSKLDLLRGAMEKGFEAAEQAWGGKLPDVSYETRKLIQQGFENWKNPALEVQ